MNFPPFPASGSSSRSFSSSVFTFLFSPAFFFHEDMYYSYGPVFLHCQPLFRLARRAGIFAPLALPFKWYAPTLSAPVFDLLKFCPLNKTPVTLIPPATSTPDGDSLSIFIFSSAPLLRTIRNRHLRSCCLFSPFLRSCSEGLGTLQLFVFYLRLEIFFFLDLLFFYGGSRRLFF